MDNRFFNFLFSLSYWLTPVAYALALFGFSSPWWAYLVGFIVFELLSLTLARLFPPIQIILVIIGFTYALKTSSVLIVIIYLLIVLPYWGALIFAFFHKR